MNLGTFSLSDLYDVKFSNLKISELDFSKLTAAIQHELTFWENQVRDGVSAFAETSTDSKRIWGNTGAGEFEELDEYGKPSAQKFTTGQTVNFPLRRFGMALGWTSLWFATHRPSEMSDKVKFMTTAANKLSIKLMQEAVYYHENKTVKDLFDGTSLSVKRWVNNDGATTIPESNGKTFASTHTHFLTTSGSGVLANQDVLDLIETVREHNTGTPVLIINEGNVAEVSALSGFVALGAPVINYVATDSTIEKLDINSDPQNRMVGYFKPNYTPVYTKPWAVEDYYVAMVMNATEKPLVRRVPVIEALQGLHLEAANDTFPLHADNYAVIEGWGCWNRLGGAVLSKGSSYTDPSL
jgi:hypothetical protein